ncbi:MAG: cupin domain-containing protein [Candidatus Omnitrophica bacterium]|nr:cupin domain-containing protein [Candidatus Omnitrophota bacterium]
MEPNHSEVLTIGPPARGEIVIKVDPRRTGAAFAMGTESLAPGAVLPVHRHFSQDEVLFIYKGQGRATLEGKSMTVLPGTMLYVPRQAWHGLRNTGTGLLQFTWTAAPPGIEEFFRELSRLGPQADAVALSSLAQRHGLEFHPAGEEAAAALPGHRRRRRHRGRRGGLGHAQPQAAPAHPTIPTHAAPAQPAAPSSASRPHRRRRRGGRGRPAQPAAGTPARASPPPQPAKTPPRPPGRPQGRPRARRGRVKEVYMEGRWVQVSGEGPVIAPGRDRPREGGSRADRDEDTPSGPLSVPL